MASHYTPYKVSKYVWLNFEPCAKILNSVQTSCSLSEKLEQADTEYVVMLSDSLE